MSVRPLRDRLIDVLEEALIQFVELDCKSLERDIEETRDLLLRLKNGEQI